MRSRTLLVAYAMTAILRAVAVQAAPEPDFAGKTITVVISFEAGGPYDLYGRLLARHLGNHLPGNPRVIVQNMAGAGGLVGMNYLYNVAPRDGTTMGVVSQTVGIAQALHTTPGIRYDVRNMAWLGRIASNVEVEYSLTRSGFTDIRQAEQHTVNVAGTGPTSSSVVFPSLLNKLIGTKFHVVKGYQGPASARLAMDRGEVAATVKPWSSIKVTEAAALKARLLSLIVQYVPTRSAELKDVPAVVELGRDQSQRDILGFFASGGTLGTSVVAPPGLSEAQVVALRKGIADTLADASLRDEAAGMKLDIDPLPGADLQKVVTDSLSVSPATLSLARKLSDEIAE
jgi:tripartite-type tricarboxylate transporter receptor subunit TctC